MIDKWRFILEEFPPEGAKIEVILESRYIRKGTVKKSPNGGIYVRDEDRSLDYLMGHSDHCHFICWRFHEEFMKEFMKDQEIKEKQYQQLLKLRAIPMVKQSEKSEKSEKMENKEQWKRFGDELPKMGQHYYRCSKDDLHKQQYTECVYAGHAENKDDMWYPYEYPEPPKSDRWQFTRHLDEFKERVTNNFYDFEDAMTSLVEVLKNLDKRIKD